MGLEPVGSVKEHPMKIESDSTREELLALLDFPDSALADYDDDRIFRSRAGKIIAALTPVGTKPKAWWV